MKSFILLLAVVLVAITAEETGTCPVGDKTCAEEAKKAKNGDGDDPPCLDQHENCGFWAEKGECVNNPHYMLHNCPQSCEVCGWSATKLKKVIDKRKKALQGDTEEEKEEEPNLEETLFGVAQNPDGDRKEEILKVIENVTKYMEEIVFVDPAYSKIKNDCKNRNKLCAFWALIGECDANPAFMQIQCAPSCYTCDQIDFDNRCPYDGSVPTVWNVGDGVNKMFERITSEPYYEKYQPTIYVQPNPPASSDSKEGPWVITLDNFLTDQECDLLIKLGREEGYEQSMDVGPKKFDGSYEGFKNSRRTSTNAWCQEDCYKEIATKVDVVAKMENLTGIPDANSEYLQLLQYEVGQFYRQHHDYIEHHTERQEGVRILTVFLYLNDVEAGGGTNFPKLDVTVLPKRGRVLLWPSVLDEDPNRKDPRTDHQALPVEKGIKYGANAWLHQRDFKEAYKRGCH
eukprot:CAMPEP_0194207460 /NCGR_PEP_ID=MMETSP0156-20130528/6190_1 /TAXON_ID=33649 /ORGANISM="Thalassionema nitzschioides, Strain L26-B" /LENGTH=456 /DNA_ID=CAMNT_0038934231 /DNA_START=10 /DNA_END=1380 /DNA_ORIENTATION=-